MYVLLRRPFKVYPLPCFIIFFARVYHSVEPTNRGDIWCQAMFVSSPGQTFHKNSLVTFDHQLLNTIKYQTTSEHWPVSLSGCFISRPPTSQLSIIMDPACPHKMRCLFSNHSHFANSGQIFLTGFVSLDDFPCGGAYSGLITKHNSLFCFLKNERKAYTVKEYIESCQFTQCVNLILYGTLWKI